MMENKRPSGENLVILAIGAHPDDIELGAAMVLFDHRDKGDEIYYVVCSDGENGGDRDVRVEEAQKAADILGVKEVYFLHLLDSGISRNDAKDGLEKVIKLVEPHMVYTHFPKDTHQDHETVSEATATACRRGVSAILNYPAISTQYNDFYEKGRLYYVGSEADYKRKEDLLKIYTSQPVSRTIVLETLKHMAGSHAFLSRCQSFNSNCPSGIFPDSARLYAEIFCPNHVVLNRGRGASKRGDQYV